MADYDLLTIRLHGMAADLERTQSALANERLGDLGGPVRDRFCIQIDRLQKQIDGLVDSLDDGDTASRRETWDGYRNYRKKSDRVIEECADFIQGALARNAHIDLGAAAVADDLAEYLHSITKVDWSKMTIFGAMDFTTRSSGIIRLAFPHFDVWSIPIVAHEFGHHVLEELRDADRVRDKQDNEVFPIIDVVRKHREKVKRKWLRELFSDLFATYSVGPAFVMSLIFDQLDAVFPHNPSVTHPQASWRAAFAISALRRLGEATAVNAYEEGANTIERAWSDAVAAAGLDPDISPDEVALLEHVLDDFWTALSDNTSAELRYGSWTRARQLSLSIMERAAAGQAAPPYEFVKPSDTVVDILNAAWRARLVGDEPTGDVADISLRLARDVTAGGE